MKRRFQVTLLAVAIASLSASAFAMAPVISDFKSPIIADDTPATGSNDFVYPDVFDLNNQATDPDNTVAPSGIIWSFTGDGTYVINNRAPMNLGTDDPNAPGTKEVGKTGQDDSESVDSNPRTITFRNAALSPDGGSRTDPGGGPGIKPTYTKPVTLFASDGSTYSMKTFLVYTDNDGADRLSPATSTSVVVSPQTPATTGSFPWTSADLLGGAGSETFSESGGLCINSPMAGANFGAWISPYGILPLLANQVYRVRITLNAPTAIAAGVTPVWDFVIDNFGSATVGESKYSADYVFWDNNGNANSVGLADPNGRHVFDLWFSPLPISAADWNDPNTGEFRAANDANNDGRLQFRTLDVDNSAVDGQNDAGTLCMTQYQVDRVDLSSMNVSSNLYNQTTFSASTNVVTTIVNAAPTNTSYTGGAATISPSNSTAWDLEVITFDPGDNNVNYSNPSTLSDNWPIPWTSNQLLKYTCGIQAPDATGESNPPDAISLQMDPASTEVLESDLLALTTNKIGGPKASTVNDYTMFYYTHNKSQSPISQLGFLRTRVGILNRTDLHNPGTKTGGIKITYEKVDVIDSSTF